MWLNREFSAQESMQLNILAILASTNLAKIIPVVSGQFSLVLLPEKTRLPLDQASNPSAQKSNPAAVR